VYAQAFLIEYATLRFSDRAIVEVCVAVLTGSFLLLAPVTTAAGLCMMMVPLVPAGCLLATVNTSQLTKVREPCARGSSNFFLAVVHTECGLPEGWVSIETRERG
jgi:hypothetical protein